MGNPVVDQRQCYPNGEYLSGQDLIDFVRSERGDTILLSFSGGKDSVAMWLYLREHFNIIPYYLYLVPGMSYVDCALRYYEDYFGVHVLRLPHPEFYRMLNAHVWQTPETVATIRALDLPNFTYADVDDLIADEYGLINPFCAIGMRRADGLQRRRLIDQMGVVGYKSRRFFYPLWDWKVADVGHIIKRHNLKLSPEYNMFGRTVVALNYRRLREIKKYYPADYDIILMWFPLAELEIFRYEQVGQ